MVKNIILISSLLLTLISEGMGQYPFPYRLSQPAGNQTLPAILAEISGLTDVDENHIACVQDELGIIFIYDIKSTTIDKQIPFDEPGDYEGLTRVGNGYYILRSDGRLTHISSSGKTNSVQLPLVTANNEGLCYDDDNKRMLIAAKSKPIDHDFAGKRLIYEYDLVRGKLKSTPAYSVDVADIENRLSEFGIDPKSGRVNAQGKVKPFNFRPSSLAVHPKSKHIYIISAADKLLVVINRTGKVVHLESLNYEYFTKPEGITFSADGTMIITNEAAGKQPNLLIFKSVKH